MLRRDFLAAGVAVLSIAGCSRPADGGASGTGTPSSGRTPRGDVRTPTTEDEPGAPPETEHGGPGPTGRPDVDAAEYPSTAHEWGEDVTGVKTRLATDRRVIALTFDACGGDAGSGYDRELVDFLRAEGVPATLFFNKRWIDANEQVFVRLAGEDLFDIANHGTEHRPLSVSGESAYGIAGTESPAAVVDEIMTNQEAIRRLTGRLPGLFRSGTAHYDEVAVRIADDLGLGVVNYDVLGDAGATYTSGQVSDALGTAQPGSIALLHMNHPGSGTARGVMTAVPALRDRGYEFVRLGDQPLT